MRGGLVRDALRTVRQVGGDLPFRMCKPRDSALLNTNDLHRLCHHFHGDCKVSDMYHCGQYGAANRAM